MSTGIRMPLRDDGESAVAALLEAHRRFHAAVGCPGGDDCYVCVAEDAYAAIQDGEEQ